MPAPGSVLEKEACRFSVDVSLFASLCWECSAVAIPSEQTVTQLKENTKITEQKNVNISKSNVKESMVSQSVHAFCKLLFRNNYQKRLFESSFSLKLSMTMCEMIHHISSKLRIPYG